MVSSQSDFIKSRFFEVIVRDAPACIALLRGPDFTFEIVNSACAAIAPGTSMQGSTMVQAFPEVKDSILPLLKKVLETGEPFRVDDQPLAIRKDSESEPQVRYFSFSYTRIADGSTPDTHSILVLAIETTERKASGSMRMEADLELKRQWRTFDTALSNSADFIYTFDLNGRLTYVNRALLSLWQLSLEDALGKNFFDLNYPDPLARRLHSQIQAVIDTGERIKDETPYVGPTGETRYYEYIFVPVFTTAGSVEAVSGSTRDVTDRKNAEQQELARQETLRESARLESLGIMAAGVAHDFNNLLTGIMGHASLLENSAHSPEERASAEQIVIASERAAELTRQMLAFSGKGQFLMENFDLNCLIKDNISLFRASLLASLTLDLQLDFGDCVVRADRAQMQQVVMNLLINASEATGSLPGTITVRTAIRQTQHTWFSNRLHTTLSVGRYVVLEVTDNGTGMDEQTLKRLFDPFFTTKFTGRGLGLAAVLGIIKGTGAILRWRANRGWVVNSWCSFQLPTSRCAKGLT